MPIQGETAARGTGSRMWRRGVSAGGLLLVVAGAAVGQGTAGQAATQTVASRAAVQAAAAPAATKVWKLTWQDGFNVPADLKKWTFVKGGNGFGVKQLQWYRPVSATIGSGNLVITAAKGGGSNHCWYGHCKYTSARMNTVNTFTQTYGRFEARIKFPPGQGLWPAFWLEGANVNKVGWPKCGEIDIVEPNGKNTNQVRAYAHGPNHQGIFVSYNLPKPLSAGFHVYGVDWSPTQIRWWVDGHTYGVMKSYKGWPFSHPFFIILNLAVGGGYSGPPTASTPFPARMLVDWVRVYK